MLGRVSVLLRLPIVVDWDIERIFMRLLDDRLFDCYRLLWFLYFSLFEAMAKFVDVVYEFKDVWLSRLVNRTIFGILDQVVFDLKADLYHLRRNVKLGLETLFSY